MSDVLNINSSGGNVGCHEHIDLAVAEGSQRLLACALTQVAVHGARGKSALGEFVGNALRGALGTTEDDREASALGLQDARDQFGLVEYVRAPHVLLGRLDGRARIVRVGCAYVRWLRHVATGQVDDLTGHRGREQHGLARRRGLRHQSLNVGQEAHVEHLVGLVENENSHVRQIEVTLLGEIDQASGRAHDHLNAMTKCFDLRFVGAAAVHRQHANSSMPTGELEIAGDLDAQFARRHDDESLRLTGSSERVKSFVLRSDGALQQRDAESECLACSGFCLADEVLAGKGERQGECLNGEGVRNSRRVERGDGGRVDAELGEGGGTIGRGRRFGGQKMLQVNGCAFRVPCVYYAAVRDRTRNR